MQDIRIDRQLVNENPSHDLCQNLIWFNVFCAAADVGLIAIVVGQAIPQFVGFVIALAVAAIALIFFALPRLLRSLVTAIVPGLQDFLTRLREEAELKKWQRMVDEARERELAATERRVEAERAQAERESLERDGAQREHQERLDREERERILAERRRTELEELERQREELARQQWEAWHARPLMDELEQMSGRDFEQFLIRLLLKIGYTEVSATPINDFGGDIVAFDPEGFRVAIQAKRWKDKVGISAVQECLSGMIHYHCDGGMVVTTGRFTKQARILANDATNVELCDRNWIQEQITAHMAEVPPFSWSEYEIWATTFKESPKRPHGNGRSDVRYLKVA